MSSQVNTRVVAGLVVAFLAFFLQVACDDGWGYGASNVVLKSTGTKPRITRTDGKIFQLDNVHFHWGRTANEGSEHTISGVRFALEMHAVHKRVKPNGDPVAPAEITVVASLFQNSINSAASDRGLSKFISYAASVKQFDASVPVPPFAWSELIPEFTDGFYAYKGSLTTPPCSEVVTFYVRGSQRTVTTSQLAYFRQLLNEEQRPIAGNFRSIQPRNSRNIFYFMP